MLKFFALIILAATAYGTEEREEAFTSASTVAGQTVVHETAVIRIPHGTSSLTEKVTPFAGSPLKVVSIVSSSCPANPVGTVKVHLTETGEWEETTLQNGWDYYSGKAFDSVQLVFNQNSYVEVNCRLKIYGTGTALPPVPTVDKLVGALKFPGGFEQSLSLALAAPRMARYIRFEVPAFCKDVEILEARTTSEGVEDQATPVSASGGKVFAVNQGNGMRISQVSAALVGPSGAVCDIPVFITE